MKKTAFLLIISVVFTLQLFSQETYKVTCTLPTDSLNGHTVRFTNVYLSDLVKPYVLDTTTVQNGTFSFTGSVNEPVLAKVSIRKNTYGFIIAHLILEQGEVNITFKDNDGYILSGTPLNEEYYRDMVEPYQLFAEDDTLKRLMRKVVNKDSITQEDREAQLNYLKSPRMRAIMKNRHERENEFMERNIHKYPAVVASLIMDRYMVRRQCTEQIAEKYAARIREYAKRYEEEIEERLKEHPEALSKYKKHMGFSTQP